MTRRPNAAIIGAGISGRTAGKNLADDGIDYERRMRKRELPAGLRRAQALGPVPLARRALV